MNLEKFIAYNAIVRHTDQVIQPDQTVNPLDNTQCETKMGRRRIGELNIRNFTGIEASNSYLGALHDAIDIRELGIKLDVLGKRLTLISNQKDDECKEGDARQDECSGNNVAILHYCPPTSVRTVLLSWFSRH